jgi:hypothetical protein
MKYILIIVDNNWNMYEDIALQLKYSFDKNNIDNCITTYENAKKNNFLKNDQENHCIFFGTAYKKYYIPKNSILTDFDNDRLLDKIFTKELFDNNKIITYSKLSLEKIKTKYNTINIGLFHFGYSGYQDLYLDLKKDIDICYLGGSEERRQFILNELSKEFKCVYKYGIFGEERQKLYSRSKIILSIYSEDYLRYFPSSSRIFPAVSNGAFVISEKCLDEQHSKILENICVNVEYKDMISTIKYFLKNEAERECLRKQYYMNIKKIECKIDV